MPATLAFIRDNGAGLEARCTACSECEALDVEALIKRHGEAMTLDRLERALKPCPACGAPAKIETAALRHGPVG